MYEWAGRIDVSGVLGTVWNEIDQVDHTPFIQCRTCHEDVPAGMPPWKPLSETNPYLKDPEERKKWIRLTVESSAAVEGVRVPKSKEKGNDKTIVQDLRAQAGVHRRKVRSRR